METNQLHFINELYCIQPLVLIYHKFVLFMFMFC